MLPKVLPGDPGWRGLWLRHAGAHVRKAQQEGSPALDHRTVRHCLEVMDTGLSMLASVRGTPEGPYFYAYYITPAVSDAAKRFIESHREEALAIARVLLKAPNTYPEGHPYYTRASSEAWLDLDMRKRALLVVLLLRDKASLEAVREARKREHDISEALKDGTLPVSGDHFAAATDCPVEVLCDFVIKVLEKDIAVHWVSIPDKRW
jgi:hypothetical protein